MLVASEKLARDALHATKIDQLKSEKPEGPGAPDYRLKLKEHRLTAIRHVIETGSIFYPLSEKHKN